MSHQKHEKNPRPSNTGVHSSKTVAGVQAASLWGGGGVGLVNGSISAEKLEKQPLRRFDGQLAERRSGVAVLTVNPSGLSVKRQFKGRVANPQGLGDRDNVMGRSAKSRRRLMEKLSRIDLEKLSGWQRKDSQYVTTAFITLTYPQNFPDAKRAKRDLRTLKERLKYHHGLDWGIWVLEWQKRGAPHFHVVLHSDQTLDLTEFRPWLSKAWYEVADTGDEKHLKAGTQVVPVYVHDGVASLMGYMAAYMGKIEQTEPKNPETGEPIETGRTWGVWYEDNVPYESLGTVIFDSWEDWEEFKRRVAKRFEKSRYLSKVDKFIWWGGALLWGDGWELVKELTDGMTGVRWRDPVGSEGA